MENRAVPMTFWLWALNGLTQLISGQDQAARGEGFFTFILCSQKLGLSPHTCAGTVNMKCQRQEESVTPAHVSWRAYTSRSSEGGILSHSVHMDTYVQPGAGWQGTFRPLPQSLLCLDILSPRAHNRAGFLA